MASPGSVPDNPANREAEDPENLSHSREEHSISQRAAPNPIDPLQIDHSEFDSSSDTDSAIGDDGLLDSTVSLTSSIYNYRYENGRRYHAFRSGQNDYPLPNDEREQNRLDLLHHIFRLTLDDRLFRAPISASPQRVLDVGCGTGIWAIDFADEFPSALVLGTDLSPIQPDWVPPNCSFLVDDAESDWLYDESEAFDFIHGRGLGGSIHDWPRLYRQMYQHLKPGGWLEMQEYEAWLWSDDGTLEKYAGAVCEWQEIVVQASILFGKDLNVAARQKDWIKAAGFVDVRDDVYKVPLGPWPKDPRLKRLGVYQLEQMCESVEPFTLALLTRVMHWSNESTQVLMARVRNGFRNKKAHLYVRYHFVYGRKPLEAS